jgi:hypothetical protein
MYHAVFENVEEQESPKPGNDPLPNSACEGCVRGPVTRPCLRHLGQQFHAGLDRIDEAARCLEIVLRDTHDDPLEAFLRREPTSNGVLFPSLGRLSSAFLQIIEELRPNLAQVGAVERGKQSLF